MLNLIVTASNLNRRNSIPASLPDQASVFDVVAKGYIFEGEEVTSPWNGTKWYKDNNHLYYSGKGVSILHPSSLLITPDVKNKIEQIINAFETGRAGGNYSALATLQDYNDPDTGKTIVQVTYGRSQTTEFGHLKTLVKDYIQQNGKFTDKLLPFLNRIGRKPSLATEPDFCDALKQAGKKDPIMKDCQDRLFEDNYYKPAFRWFSKNEFTLPLSMLVIYDSKIHSGGIPTFLRKRFKTSVPVKGGNEKEWLTDYVNVRHNWLSTHKNTLLRKTVYRTNCFKSQIQNGNWDLAGNVNANGVIID